MTVWIFLDVGGTFVDETAAWQARIVETALLNGVSADELKSCMERCSAQNLPPYGAALQQLGFLRTKNPWHTELEAPVNGAAQVLEALSGRFKLGVIANQSLGTADRLEKWGLLKYFTNVTASAEAGFSKPDERIFLAALDKSGCSPEEAVMVGDRLDNDIIPAKSLGMTAIWVKHGLGGLGNPDLLSLKPDYTAESFSELLQIPPFAIQK